MNYIDEMDIKHLNEAIKDGSLIIFVGAGVSANSGLPNWSELIDVFKDELKIEKSENDYLKIAQYYYESVGKQKYLNKVLEVLKKTTNSQPNEIHDEIFRINPRHIITTNYDDLLEKRAEKSISEYYLIKEDKDIPYSKADRYIIKMHGDLGLKNMVLKEDDYLDYEDSHYMISTLIKSLIMNNTLLFIGYSLNDLTFNKIFRRIQKGFGGEARTAYFYEPNQQNSATIDYYKNKGIKVISSGENIEKDDLGSCTANFLKMLSSDEAIIPQNAIEIWDNIKHLDQLSFVNTQTVTEAVNLSGTRLMYSVYFDFNNNKDDINFDILENVSITNFLKNKTNFKRFLGFDNSEEEEHCVQQNLILSEAFKMYENKRYDDAKNKFREIANQAFKNKDYWNYLIAEFNVSHIVSQYPRSTEDIPESIAGYDSLNKIVDSLISILDGENRKLCIYFRDEILSFKFIYKKVYKMNELLDNLRKERYVYRNGGGSSNRDLLSVKYEFKTLLTFINANCITVFQYREFKDVALRYFECILIAFDNSNYGPNKDSFIEGTSSSIEKLSLSDLKLVIPHLDSKKTAYVLDSYDLSKIKVSDDVIYFLIDEILSLLKDINNSTFDYDRLSKFINVLSITNMDDIDVEKIINVLEKLPIPLIAASDLDKTLSLLIEKSNKISEAQYNKILQIIMSHMTKIITHDSLISQYQFTFNYYEVLLKEISKKEGLEILCIENLEEKLISIDINNKLKEIIKFEQIISKFYLYFPANVQNTITSILKKYEELEQVNFPFIKAMILNNVYDFGLKKQDLLNSEIKLFNSSNNAIMTYPNPRRTAIADIFTLIQFGYFSKSDIEKKLNLSELKGVFPEVDWVLLNDYSDKTIEGLIKKRSFLNVREIFGTSEEEKRILESWLLKQGTEDRIIFKEKKNHTK